MKWSHGRHRKENFWDLGLQIAQKYIFLGFFFGSFEEKLTRKIHTTLLYARCKHLNQRVRRIDRLNGKSFKAVLKTKKKKTHEETEFHNLVQDWVFTTVYWL